MVAVATITARLGRTARQRAAGLLAVVAMALSPAATAPAAPPRPAARPNVLVIVADDLGYSDLGSYGGEIATPNLDRLAARGVRMTHFHVNPSCSPTRASLLSGADQHVAGVGAMAEAIPPAMRGHAGFEGVLTRRVATIAERFAAAGYRTMMAGKWHLGAAAGQRPGDRGFADSFALMQGAANHFGRGGFGADDNPMTGATYLANGRPVTPGPDFYSSDAFTDRLLDALRRGDRRRPFFAYLAFTAPHAPLQAPAADIARYHGRYDAGWSALARRRLTRMQAMGVLPGAVPDPAAFGPDRASWEALSPAARAMESRKAEVYAAMVTRLDRNVGRVLDLLERTGQRDNTIILFMSDNGPAGETAERFAMMPGVAAKVAASDATLRGAGGPASFLFYSPDWARASAAPSRLFKGYLTEGGTLVPAIWSYRGLPAGGTNAVVSDVRDVATTLLALAHVPASTRVDGREVAYLEGADLSPYLLAGRADRPIAAVANAFYGQAMVRAGAWKLLRLPSPAGDGAWHLYDTRADPAERDDRLAAEPERVRSMLSIWSAYADRHDIPR